ncbi:Uncharacterised protein [Escherichia coli]|nr:Uncharacterised protein [Escherichia coli]
MIGGWLVLVVLLALPLLVIPGLLVQRPLARAGERRNARVSGTQRYAGGSRAVD